MDVQRNNVAGPKAVSYTHLDVYKRQAYVRKKNVVNAPIVTVMLWAKFVKFSRL